MGFDYSKAVKNTTNVVDATTVKEEKKVESVPVQKIVEEVKKEEVKVIVRQEKKIATVSGGLKNMNAVVGLSDEILGLSVAELNARIDSAIDSITKIKEELNDEFVERDNEIDMMALALIAGVNAFFHGPAGTGKSGLVEGFSNRIVNANYFRTLMGKTTEPGEVFGPLSINAMKNDSYKVNTKGKLPEAHIAFVDEVFKCNSAVLNSLLTIMNEKMFFNDGIQEVPLISMIGASNEYMEEDNLLALYDRFLLRWHVDYIQDANSRINLFKSFLSKRNSSSVFQSAVALTTVDNSTKLDIEDLLLLNEKAKEVTIGAKVLKEYNKLFIILGKQGIVISDRRKNESLKVLQASAIMNGRDSVDIADFEALKYTLWNTQDQIQAVSDELTKLANPNANRYNQYKKVLADYKADLEKLEANKDADDYSFNKSITITETVKNLQFAITTIQGIIPNLKAGSKEHNKFTQLLKDIEDYITEIRSQIII